MMIKIRSIHMRIFMYFSVLVLLMIFAFSFAVSVYMTSALRENVSENLSQLSGTIMKDIDTEIEKLSDTSIKIIASQSVKNRFFDYSQGESARFSNANELIDLLLSIVGYKRSFYQVNLFRNDGVVYEFGVVNGVSNRSYMENKSRPWAEEVLALEGFRYINPTHVDSTNPRRIPVVSVCRAFAEIYGMTPNNIIEIQQDYSFFEDLIHNALSVNNQKTEFAIDAYVFDAAGSLIYPYPQTNAEQEAALDYWNAVNNEKGENGIFRRKNSATAEMGICSFNRSEYTSFTTLLIEPETYLKNPVYSLNTKVVLLGILALLIVLVITYYISQSLSAPIRKLRESIGEVEIATLEYALPPALESDIDELEQLNRSFLDMRKRLTLSLHETILARTNEIQSKMLAMQSQMNPHFLYNTLYLISVICDEKNVPEVVDICNDMSGMLRYITTDSVAPVLLNEEIEHATKYISLCRKRLGKSLVFTAEVPPQMLTIRAPKLILQPLLENIIKYAGVEGRPLVIEMNGLLEENIWRMTVSDNGEGFSPEKLAELKSRMSEINVTALPQFHLENMGLINIYARLKLFYGDKMVFEIGNTAQGGAYVAIGGTI